MSKSAGAASILPADVDEIGALSHLTFARAWIAVLTLAAIVVGVVVWSFVGIITTQVAGLGIALPQSFGLQPIEAGSAGPVARVLATPGQTVKAGDRLVVIDQVVANQQLTNAQRDLRAARRDRERRAAVVKADLAARAASTEAQIGALNAKITSLNSSIAFRQRYLGDLRGELGQGYTTRSAVEQARTDLVQAQLDLKQAQNQIQQVQIQQSEAVGDAEKERAQLDGNVLNAEQAVADSQTQLNLASAVLAPFNGRIVAVATAAGAQVTIGQPVATIAPDAAGLEVVAYFQVGDGKRISLGANALIAFDSVDPDVYGTAIGTVTEIGEVPETSQSLNNTLGNATIVQQLTGGFAPLAVHIRLLGQPGTITFTSGVAPPVRISSGTTARVSVTVEQDHPVAFVIPFFRVLGGS